MCSNLSDCCRRSIEHYKENNAQLAFALNETRKENRKLNDVLMQRSREYHQKCDEIAQLKADTLRKEAQLAIWQTRIADVVKNNTRGLSQLMEVLSAQSTANTSNHNNDANVPPIAPPIVATIRENTPENNNLAKSRQTVGVVTLQRRKSLSAEGRNSLPKLIEESNAQRSPSEKRRASEESQSETSDSSVATPSPIRTSRRTLRRSSSLSSQASLSTPSSSSSSSSPVSSPASPSSPSSPNVARRTARRCKSVFETEFTPATRDNTKKTVKNVNSRSEKENDVVNVERHINGRPRRKAAPAQLKEEKLNIKLRRRQ